MGNRQVSGLLSFTVYTRGTPPRHWVCGIIEQQTGVIRHDNTLALLSPLGAGSEADVLLSNLGIGAGATTSGGWEAVAVTGTFDGTQQFQAQLNTRREIQGRNASDAVSLSNTWNAVFQGQDGQVHILSIEFKVTAHSPTHGWTAETHVLCLSTPPLYAVSLTALILSPAPPMSPCAAYSLASW